YAPARPSLPTRRSSDLSTKIPRPSVLISAAMKSSPAPPLVQPPSPVQPASATPSGPAIATAHAPQPPLPEPEQVAHFSAVYLPRSEEHTSELQSREISY